MTRHVSVACAVASALLLGSSVASAQVFVYPQRPGKSVVRYFDFDWRYVDLQPESAGAAEGPGPGGRSELSVGQAKPGATGGVRLYFYEQERPIAERAAAYINATYRRLVEVFAFEPPKPLPYVLYSSYQEFLQTNLFALQEGVLGVTSTQDLKLALPYFGDERLFEEVSSHEMVHQFTIQKVQALARKDKLSGDPLRAVPLWLIEGMAEYFSKEGMDPEAELLIRDLVVSGHGGEALGFFSEEPMTFVTIYKLGQARCAFLEATYGHGTLQRVLEQSVRLVGETQGRPQLDNFKALLAAVTGDNKESIETKYESWLKRRAFASYLKAAQDSSATRALLEFNAPIDGLTVSPDGNLLMYRDVDVDIGQLRLRLVDWRAPSKSKRVVGDGVPGVESLHLVSERNFAVGPSQIAYVAQDGGHDVIYVQSYSHRARTCPGLTKETLKRDVAPPGCWDVQIELGDRQEYHLEPWGILAVSTLAMSPDGARVGFIGLSATGTKDLFIFDPPGANGPEARVTRLTNDPYAERGLAWGKDGLVYASDATADRRFNLFRHGLDAAIAPERLTVEARDESDPMVSADGRIFFIASETDGRSNIYEVTQEGIVQRTDIATGLFNVSAGPDGGLWALVQHNGERHPGLFAKERLLALPHAPEPQDKGAEGPPRDTPELTLGQAHVYEALRLENWEPGDLFGILGIGGGGVFGQVLATANDKLRNHGLILNVAAFGRADLIDGYLIYINQERRWTWAAGPFQSLRQRPVKCSDDPNADPNAVCAITLDRFYGLTGLIRYPLNRFVYVQADLSAGGYKEIDSAKGTQFQTELALRWGYDTIRYHWATGPLDGHSLLLEVEVGGQPARQKSYTSFRLDAEQHLHIFGLVHALARLGAGTTLGGGLAREFFLSSFDTLRGVPFFDAYLLGSTFLFSTAELRFPLDEIVRVILFQNIEGVVGIEFGGVGEDSQSVWNRRVADWVLGFDLGLGPLVLRLHFAQPFRVGKRRAGGERLLDYGRWVTNFSLAWRYF